MYMYIVVLHIYKLYSHTLCNLIYITNLKKIITLGIENIKTKWHLDTHIHTLYIQTDIRIFSKFWTAVQNKKIQVSFIFLNLK